MALQFGPRLRAFLDEPIPIIIGTTQRDGSVQMTPLWYEYRDGQIWLNGGPARDWFKHLQRDPRVSLLVLDPKQMFRWARIQGRLVSHSLEGGDEHIERLSRRYTGGPYRNPKIDRMIVRIDPERVAGYEVGQPWDVNAEGR
jgi:PPOX class probable F420-dependent enzyme